ncbi:hypothetical protein BDZ91DRAFT_731838 [Kalaharituber pfeilii]|nr:hypothetical protein BDZ91DRAFT_731838 [Kalaharituber pfeilii]
MLWRSEKRRKCREYIYSTFFCQLVILLHCYRGLCVGTEVGVLCSMFLLPVSCLEDGMLGGEGYWQERRSSCGEANVPSFGYLLLPYWGELRGSSPIRCVCSLRAQLRCRFVGERQSEYGAGEWPRPFECSVSSCEAAN